MVYIAKIKDEDIEIKYLVKAEDEKEALEKMREKLGGDFREHCGKEEITFVPFEEGYK